MLKIVILLVSVVTLAHGYETFQPKIPNGKKVPNPCQSGAVTWPGVGHEAVAGDGSRNPFGKDFKTNNKVWDATLCNKDSDGDGKTNGQELGDPDCVWTEGGSPSSTTGLSHPGVCEPVNSDACKGRNTFLNNNNCPASALPSDATTTVDSPTTAGASGWPNVCVVNHLLLLLLAFLLCLVVFY